MEEGCHWLLAGEYSWMALWVTEEEEPPVTDRGCSNQEVSIYVHLPMGGYQNTTIGQVNV